MKRYLNIAFILSIFLAGCSSARKTDRNYAGLSFETVCLACDGMNQTVRAWGKGKNKNEAMTQCRKQALRDIIFKGVNLGDQGCLRRPLIAEVNSEERHRKFFNEFFSDKGRWSRYATLNDKKRARIVSKSHEMETWEASVEIDINALGTYLKDNGMTVINY